MFGRRFVAAPCSVLVALALSSLLAMSASADTLHVATTGNDDTGDGSVVYPYATIQRGIDVAVNGARSSSSPAATGA